MTRSPTVSCARDSRAREVKAAKAVAQHSRVEHAVKGDDEIASRGEPQGPGWPENRASEGHRGRPGRVAGSRSNNAETERW